MCQLAASLRGWWQAAVNLMELEGLQAKNRNRDEGSGTHQREMLSFCCSSDAHTQPISYRYSNYVPYLQ